MRVEKSEPVENISHVIHLIISDQEETPLTQNLRTTLKNSSNLSEKLLFSNYLSLFSKRCGSTSEPFTPKKVYLDLLDTIAKILNLSPIKKDLDQTLNQNIVT